MAEDDCPERPDEEPCPEYEEARDERDGRIELRREEMLTEKQRKHASRFKQNLVRKLPTARHPRLRPRRALPDPAAIGTAPARRPADRRSSGREGCSTAAGLIKYVEHFQVTRAPFIHADDNSRRRTSGHWHQGTIPDVG